MYGTSWIKGMQTCDEMEKVTGIGWWRPYEDMSIVPCVWGF
jgi:hypothetical protein